MAPWRRLMLVVVLSPKAVESRQVRSEWNLAIEEGKPVLPVVREKCRVPRQLRLYQQLDMTAGQIDDEGVLTRLVNAIQSL